MIRYIGWRCSVFFFSFPSGAQYVIQAVCKLNLKGTKWFYNGSGRKFSDWIAGGAREQVVHDGPSKSWREIKCRANFVLTSWLQKTGIVPDTHSALAAKVTSRLDTEWCQKSVKSHASYSRGHRKCNILWTTICSERLLLASNPCLVKLYPTFVVWCPVTVPLVWAQLDFGLIDPSHIKYIPAALIVNWLLSNTDNLRDVNLVTIF